MSDVNPGDWKPLVTLDIEKATRASFVETTEEFDRLSKELGDPPPLTLSNGWYTIEPPMQEDWLRRNVPGANRKLGLEDCKYYYRQMTRSDWLKNGESIIFTVKGVLVNGQHRLWGAYLGGASFDSYVIFDVPIHPLLFASIDNGKMRTGSTALATAGFDGISPMIVAIINMRETMAQGGYTMQRAAHRPVRMYPLEILRLAEQDPILKEAARATATECRRAILLVRRRDVVAYVNYQILAAGYDEIVLEEFWRDVDAPEGELLDDNPAVQLRRLMEVDRKRLVQMPKHIALACVTKAFNLWRAGQTVKRLKVSVTDEFPVVTLA